ncbi:MAG: hypothetical protein CME35_01915 [Gramella sp.]|nr:hypothetical protein [Christiangramia sp.]
MLTSFFNKSKPLSLIVIIVLLCLFYTAYNFEQWFLDFELLLFLKKLVLLITLVFSLLVLNFIAKKNELTKRSAYKTLFFTLFAVSFANLMQSETAIIANLFVVLALRRLISLRSRKFIQKKIFDASFWIAIASLYQFWSILFLGLVFMAILNFAAYFKNWLIPLVAVVSVAILTVCFHLVVYEELYYLNDWFQMSNFDFSFYGNLQMLIPLSILLGLLVWTILNYFSMMQKASVTRRPVLGMILLSLAIAAVVAVFAPTKNGSELIFFLAPFSIITSSYFDGKKDRVFKEIVLIALLAMPFVILFLI